MTVVVTDTRTIITDAETTTGWTLTAGTGPTAGTTVFAEATNSIISTLNIATGQLYFTDATPRNLSDTLIYVWSNNFALQDLWDAAAPPNALHLGDGTDRISFKMAGINRKTFIHLDAGAGINADWDCLVLDGSQASAMNTAGLTVVRAGTFAGLDLTAITQMGSDFTTLSKGLGGGVNVATDIIRIGNDGLRITGGTTGARGKFVEIVAEDQSSADQKAHGIIRQLSTGLYSCQGPLNFGQATGSPAFDSYFQDSGRVLSFENRNISDDKYYINVEGHPSFTNVFVLANSTITTAGPFVRCDFDGANVNTLTLTNNTLVGLGNPITFFGGSPSAGHIITGNSFTGCGQIDPGSVVFTGNTISSSTDPNGSLLIDASGTTRLSDLDFNSIGSPGTGHAIYITATGSYILTNFTYTGFEVASGSPFTGNEVIFNDSGGEVTLTITGGGVPGSVRNGPGSSTIIISGAVTTLIHAQTVAGVDIVNARVHLRASDGTGPQPFEDSVTIVSAGSPVIATVSHASHGLSNGNKVLILNASPQEYNGVKTITLNAGSPLTGYNYPVSNSFPQTPTGSITSTGVIIDDVTDSNGDISDTRTFSSDQPVTGNVRKSTSSPLYKAGNIISTINSSSGLSFTTTLIVDE